MSGADKGHENGRRFTSLLYYRLDIDDSWERNKIEEFIKEWEEFLDGGYFNLWDF